MGQGQCDQIGRNFATWATLGYFYFTKFCLNKQFQHIVCC